MNIYVTKQLIPEQRLKNTSRTKISDDQVASTLDDAIAAGFTPVGDPAVTWRKLTLADVEYLRSRGTAWLLTGDYEVRCTIQVAEEISWITGEPRPE